MLRRLLLLNIAVVAIATLYGASHPPTVWGIDSSSLILALEWLLCCPITAVILMALLGRSRTSDCEFEPNGFRVIGGKYDQLVVKYRDISLDGTAIYHGKLVLDLGDGVRIHAASASAEAEARSLEAFLATLTFRHQQVKNKALGEVSKANNEASPAVLRCKSCGAPAVVDDLPEVPCHACGALVAIDEPLRARIRAARTLGKEQQAVVELVQKARQQPNAKRINQLLVALSTLGIVWLPAVIVVRAVPTAIISIAALALLYLYGHALVARRRALAVLTTDLSAHKVNDTFCCCNCGAPLPATKDVDVVSRCVYCETDNVLGFDHAFEARNTELARVTLQDAFSAHQAAIRCARREAVILSIVVCGALFLFLRDSLPATEQTPEQTITQYATQCGGSVCRFEGLAGDSRQTLQQLEREGVSVELHVQPNARLTELSEVGRLVPVTVLKIRRPMEALPPDVFRSLRSLNRVDLEGVSLSSLEHFANLPLTELSIREGLTTSDVSALRTLTGLRSLSLIGVRFSDLRDLGPLSQLAMLDLTESQISNLDGISALTSLRSFYCYRCRTLSDLSALREPPRLSSLSLAGSAITSVDALGELRELSVLRIGGTKVTDLTPIASLPLLIELDIEGLPVSSLAAVSGLRNLRKLRVDTRKLAHLDELFQFRSLKRLCVEENISRESEDALVRALPNTEIVKFPCITVSDVTAGINNIDISKILPK